MFMGSITKNEKELKTLNDHTQMQMSRMVFNTIPSDDPLMQHFSEKLEELKNL